MMRTGKRPVRFVWAGAYKVLIRISVAWIRRITPEATASLLGGQSQNALERYREWRGGGAEPPHQCVERFRKQVLGLPAYESAKDGDVPAAVPRAG